MLFNAKKLYWFAQFTGWSSYVAVAIVFNVILDQEIETPEIAALASIFVIGILVSHLYRQAILQYEWLSLNIGAIIPRIIFGTLVMSVIFELAYVLIIFLLTQNSDILKADSVIQDFVSWVLLLFTWSTLYFLYHFFKNYRKEEIKNLQLEASHNEFQINRLRSQLNPHFIFNAMNSIRSLVEEDPKKAKKAITQLSNVLRNSLLMDQKKLIPIQDEIAIVKDYLEIEKARYEDRLQVNWEIDNSKEQRMIPPLMLQTLVENSIKHGIAKLSKGGLINIKLDCVPKGCEIHIQNSGSLHQSKSSGTGYGLKSTRERLQLLYDDKASLNIYEEDEFVNAKIFIPKDSKYIKK